MSWLSNSQPVLVKELRGRMRGARAFVILTIFLLVLAVPTTLLYIAVASTVQFDQFNAGQTIGKTLFLGIVTVALIQVLIVVPGQAASALTSEKERETYDLLISTLLPPWKIIIGKLLAALAYALLLIVAVIPFMAVSFFFGGVTVLEVILALVGLVVTVVLFGSSGILWSVIMRRSLAATIVTQAVSVGLLLGLPFLVFVAGVLIFRDFPPPAWTSSAPFVYLWITALSLHPFIALGASELYLQQGETRLFFPAGENPLVPFVPFEAGNGVNFLIPHPWLLYTLEAAVLSTILIALSIRLLRPINEGPTRPRRGKGAPKKV
ncbi:MAG: ABC transporter permease [Chloroflexota bacterium]|nr:ABC transporter permease [Chloroflexota bacterium]PLS79933.1 MAG: ABC transporter permease [Chloroflexota bacterium]